MVQVPLLEPCRTLQMFQNLLWNVYCGSVDSCVSGCIEHVRSPTVLTPLSDLSLQTKASLIQHLFSRSHRLINTLLSTHGDDRWLWTKLPAESCLTKAYWEFSEVFQPRSVDFLSSNVRIFHCTSILNVMDTCVLEDLCNA